MALKRFEAIKAWGLAYLPLASIEYLFELYVDLPEFYSYRYQVRRTLVACEGENFAGSQIGDRCYYRTFLILRGVRRLSEYTPSTRYSTFRTSRVRMLVRLLGPETYRWSVECGVHEE